MPRDIPRIPDDEPLELIYRETGCVSLQSGAIVSIRRANLDGPGLERFLAGMELAKKRYPRGLVMLAAFRLDSRFPLPATFDRNLSILAETLRRIDREMAAIASVLEFGGVRAAAMELASKAVWALGRPSAKMASFRGLGEAAQWLAEVGPEVGAPADPGVYVRTYRHNDRRLRELDAAANRTLTSSG